MYFNADGVRAFALARSADGGGWGADFLFLVKKTIRVRMKSDL